ncbi:MAG: PilZ domain-containing protein [Candidatus Hodarchaeales archaeon]
MENRVKITDISIDGICLESSRHIDTKNTYSMKIVTKRNEEIMLKGEVVWSSLRKSIKEKGNIFPIYDIGLKFIEQNDEKNNFLKKITERLAHCSLKDKRNQ